MNDSVPNLIVEVNILEHVASGVEVNVTDENLVTLDITGSIMRKIIKMWI